MKVRRSCWHALPVVSFSLALGETALVWDATSIPNANHIFNAIHSATRMWGSSLNHNGMSAFVAIVAADTELYFGGDTPDAVNGTEWLAFEPELSSWSVKAPSMSDRIRPGAKSLTADPGQRHYQRQGQHTEQFQVPLPNESSEEDAVRYGYLHTYRTKHQLRLLYLDGLAGSLSSLGTSDLQDRVLLHGKDPRANATAAGNSHYIGGQPDIDDLLRADYVRADHLCALANTSWHGRVDGFLRSQWSSEIILCAFEQHLTLERATRAPQLPYGGHDDALENWIEYRAVAHRFDGIGGDRVRVDFDYFVSLFALPDAVDWDRRGLPRASNSTTVAKRAQNAIARMVLSLSSGKRRHCGSSASAVDWQAVTDQIVDRYSDSLLRLTSALPNGIGSNCPKWSALQMELDILLRPFAEFPPNNGLRGNRALEQEAVVDRCAHQYLPKSSSTSTSVSLAEAAILNVTTTLCQSLVRAQSAITMPLRSCEETESQAEAVSSVQDSLERLRSWLGWTIWKRCRGCNATAICFAPMFPLGGFDDYARPRCRNSLVGVGTEYWK